MKPTVPFLLTVRWIVVLACLFSGVKGHAQLASELDNTRSANQGLYNVFINSVLMRDTKVPYVPHRLKGPYYSLGFEYHELSYGKGESRMKYNFDLMADLVYYIIGWMRAEEVGDVDDRYSNSSFFSGGFLEVMAGANVLSRKKFNIGIGGVFYDLNYQHKLIDAAGEPPRPEKSVVSGYGLYGGWALYSDVFIADPLTLHLDFFRGYGLYHAKKESLINAGEPSTPFDSWKLTAMLLHQSGLFVNFRYHQTIAKTSIPTAAARIQFGLGYRIGMYKYKGQSHLRDPRKDPAKITF